MAWVVLIISGFMEATWAIALSESKGFKRLWPTLVFVGASLLSLGGLALAMREIPTGTAYAVWTGIGAAATVVFSLLTKREKASTVKVLFLVLLLGCVIGLKVAE